MHVKMILPALLEAHNPDPRPIKYALFPPLGLAGLAAWLPPEDTVEIVDEHVESLDLNDRPDLVVIQVYVTNALRAYRIADHYRARGVFVALGGLHVTALPEEACAHADAVFLGPGEATFPAFLDDFRQGQTRIIYVSKERSLVGAPPPRRELLRRERYLVPNALTVSRGCPNHCSFCYKDNFYKGGASHYTRSVHAALAEIDSLPGRHLYFLDDHLFGDPQYAARLFEGMRGMNRVFQGAATVASVLEGNLLDKAVEAGLRSLFIGFESIDPQGPPTLNKGHNLRRDYARAIRRLHDTGVFINGSFMFGLDSDGPAIFDRTVDWALEMGITTATFHILTPYPGTPLFQAFQKQGRILTRDWERYDTRQVVFRPRGMAPQQLQEGYARAYRNFYRWRAILRASRIRNTPADRLRHLLYAGGWKRCAPMWNALIKLRGLPAMRGFLETLLSTAPARHPRRTGIADRMAGHLSFETHGNRP